MKPKVIVLLSGGLDSRLAVKVLQEKCYDVLAMYFSMPFGSRYSQLDKIKKFTDEQRVKLMVMDCTKGKLLQDFLDILRKPKYRRGTALNPCVDCKIFMLKKAKEYADKHKIKFIATGEVLGQRPMSQQKKSLETIKEDAGLKARLLRPLTEMLGITGRTRTKQMELAKKYNITYPNAGGGCLLCEPGFCEKLRPLLQNKLEDIDVELLKVGRHFDNSNIVLGRNEPENLRLEEIKKKYKQGILLMPEEPGPTAFIKSKKYIPQAKELIRKYSKHEIKEIKTID